MTQSSRLRGDWERVPSGSFCVIPPDGIPVVLSKNVTSYEVGDGDLLLRTKRGKVVTFRAGDWVLVGRVVLPGVIRPERVAEEAS